jgi:hypothetical protein
MTDPVGQLERQLYSAAEHLVAAPVAPRRPSRKRPWRVQLAGLVVIAGLGLTAGIAAGALSLIGRAGVEHSLRETRPMAEAPSQRMQQSFSIIEREGVAGDELPGAARNVVAKDPADPDFDGANPALARRSRAQVGDFRFWVVPGNDTICLVAAAGSAAGGGCAPTRVALSGSLIRQTGASTAGLRGGELVLYGIVPDGVTNVELETTTGRRTVPVVDNVWAEAALAGTVKSVTVGDSVTPIDAPPPPPPARTPAVKRETPLRRDTTSEMK